jgi:hypothetical protein
MRRKLVNLFNTKIFLTCTICIIGLPLTQMLHLDVNTLYKQFIGDKIIDRLIGDNITDFNDFHLATLDIFKYVQSF